MMGEKKRREDMSRHNRVFENFEVKETRLEWSPCLACGKLMDAATNFDGHVVAEGGIGICFYCGHIMAYDAQLKLRNLTDEEMIAIAGDKKILTIQEARGHVMRWYGKTCFRFHRGSLSESMKTVVEVQNIDDLAAQISKQYMANIVASDLEIKLYDERPDDRIGWKQTYLVTLFGHAIGFMNDMPKS
jgi:hypothetical protein